MAVDHCSQAAVLISGSHSAGAKALADCWSVRDTEKLIQLQKELAQLQAGGLVFPPDSWPAKLLSKSPR